MEGVGTPVAQIGTWETVRKNGGAFPIMHNKSSEVFGDFCLAKA